MAVHSFPAPDLVGAVGAAMDAVAAGQDMPLALAADDDLAAMVQQLAHLGARVASWQHEVLAEADVRKLAEKEAATGTDAWAAPLTGNTREATAGGVRLAHLLRDKYHATREAFAAGRVSVAQVKVIVNAAEQAPREATPEQLKAAEEWLVTKATGDGNRGGRPQDPRRLRRSARRMFDVVDRDLADKHEQTMIKGRERNADAGTFLALHDNGDGSFSGRFRIPELQGRRLRQQLELLTSPRRLSRIRATGEVVVDESAIDPPNIYEVRGQAFLELIDNLPADGHALNGVTMIVKVNLEDLLSGLGVAQLDTGADISAGEARRLACNANLVPAVLGGDSEVLDLGRSKRLFSTAQRRAASVIHDTCAISGCERPFAWCELHHEHPWSLGGPTDLDQALPLCGYHHRRTHDERFSLERSRGGWRLRPRR